MLKKGVEIGLMGLQWGGKGSIFPDPSGMEIGNFAGLKPVKIVKIYNFCKFAIFCKFAKILQSADQIAQGTGLGPISPSRHGDEVWEAPKKGLGPGPRGLGL